MVNYEHCTGCSACKMTCVMHAIEMVPDRYGFVYPKFFPERCVHCGECKTVCPLEKNNYQIEREPEAFMASAIDRTRKTRSSSGGIFSLLAEKTLQEGGMVFGCRMSDDCLGAYHVGICRQEELPRLLGSKYIAGDVKSTFMEVNEALKSRKKVLYCGTPCQVAGLKAFLGSNDCENLTTVDFICHGVPSPLVWKKYILELEKEMKSKSQNVFFRDKARGWKNYSLGIQFSNGKYKRCPVTKNLFLRGFVSDYFLRESCYQCLFKGNRRNSDITLGDFWGIDKVEPDMNDYLGVSIVLIHKEKGRKLWESICSECLWKPAEVASALKSNPSYFNSARPNRIRNKFLLDIQYFSAKKVLKKYCGNSFVSRCRRKIANIFP